MPKAKSQRLAYFHPFKHHLVVNHKDRLLIEYGFDSEEEAVKTARTYCRNPLVKNVILTLLP